MTLSSGQSPVGFHGDKLVGWLVCQSGVHRGEDFRIPVGQTKIGSSWLCDIAIAHPGIGSEHALFKVTDNTVIMQPIGSGRDIAVNGRQILEPLEIREGDIVTFSGLDFLLKLARRTLGNEAFQATSRVTSAQEQTDVKHPMVMGWLVVQNGSLAGFDFRLLNTVNRVGSRRGLEVVIPYENFPDLALSIEPAAPHAFNIQVTSKQFDMHVNQKQKFDKFSVQDSDVMTYGTWEFYIKCA
jgi:hypothetical protein